MQYLIDHIQNRPLKKMDEFLLAAEIESRAEILGFEVEARKAIRLAALAHSQQTRANRGPYPRDTYLTHPLRNAVRALRYGVTDEHTIIAIILHDVLEDAAFFIADTLMSFGSPAKDEAQARVRAAVLLMEDFHPYVGAFVHAVSNPVAEVNDSRSKSDKRQDYQKKVAQMLLDTGPEVTIIKLVDIIDNGAGLYHNTGLKDEARRHLALKYFPLMDTFLARIEDAEVRQMLTECGYNEAKRQLLGAKSSLTKIISENT